MKKNLYYSLLFIISFYACTQEIDLPFPTTAPQIVLNGILHPDSLIQITLTKSISLQDSTKAFPFIEDAILILYENEALLDTLHYTENGHYVLDFYPKENNAYTINAFVPGHEKITASDRIPMKPSAEACYQRFDSHFIDNYVDVVTKIEDNMQEDNFYWLYLTINDFKRLTDAGLHYDSTRTEQQLLFYLLSNSPVADNFNAVRDHIYERYGYRYYIRMEDVSLNKSTVQLTVGFTDDYFRYVRMTQLTQKQSLMSNVVSASQHYDRYLKSSVIYFLNNDYLENPSLFAEPTQIYSNVENGTGIFAAYNSVSIEVEDYPCP